MKDKNNTNKKKKASLTGAFRSRRTKKERELFCIIGLGRFGSSLSRSLAAEGRELIVIDRQRDKINEVAEYCENAFVCDNLSRENLEKLGVGECDCVVVCVGSSIETSVLTVLNLINMGVGRVIAKAQNEEQGMVLEKLGAEVVYPERDMGERLALRLAHTNLLEYISLGDDVDIAELELTERADGMKVIALDLRRRFSLNIIAIRKNGITTAEIGPETVLRAGNVVAVIGTADKIAAFEKWLRA